MIRDVLFDLDDTLFDFHADERVALSRTFEALGMELTDEIAACYSRINQAQWQALERGELTRAQLQLRRYELLFEQLGASTALAPQAAKLYPQFLARSYHYLPGAKELLLRLQGRYRLSLVSNGNLAVQQGRLARSGIGAYFSNIFISEQMGAEKPNVRFFELLEQSLEGYERTQTVIVGDSLTSDMQGGKNAGIRTVWYCPKANQTGGHPLADHVICRLDELDALLACL